VKRAAALLLLAACAHVAAKSGGDENASLEFARHDEKLPALTLRELKAAVPAETWTQFDPYYQREKSWHALPLEPVLQKAFGADLTALRGEEFVMVANDGYTVPISGAKLLEGGAYLAFADASGPWEAIGPQRANPAPFYLVWKGKEQQDLEGHPRPWSLAKIGITKFETVFPKVVPKQPSEAAQRGFSIFKEQCIRCHAINRQGGTVGPELNVPQNVTEYRPRAQLKAWIKDPAVFRYSAMPSFPHLTDDELEGLLAYLEAMKAQKQDGN
jgi:mono/diheme cytochrome c family protein